MFCLWCPWFSFIPSDVDFMLKTTRCETDKGSWASLPVTNCVCKCGKAHKRGMDMPDSHPAFFPLFWHCWDLVYKRPFPFCNAHTTDLVLKGGFGCEIFSLPKAVHGIDLFICVFVLWRCCVGLLIAFIPPKVILTNKNRRTSLLLELVKKRGAREFEVPADMHSNSDLLPVGSNQLCSWVNQFVCKIDFTQPTQSWLNIKEVKMSAK